jgi:hypothetical protein
MCNLADFGEAWGLDTRTSGILRRKEDLREPHKTGTANVRRDDIARQGHLRRFCASGIMTARETLHKMSYFLSRSMPLTVPL